MDRNKRSPVENIYKAVKSQSITKCSYILVYITKCNYISQNITKCGCHQITQNQILIIIKLYKLYILLTHLIISKYIHIALKNFQTKISKKSNFENYTKKE